MIKTNIRGVRDPFVITVGDTYYLYGSDVSKGWDSCVWACYKSKSLDGKWEKTAENVYVAPPSATKQFWAPEVHKYKGKFYMLASYYSDVTGHRGCSVLRADSPDGPFVEISGGQITPRDWDAIDGTLYVDSDGAPWLVFVHEWTSTEDKVGRMALARLSDDLSSFVSEPKELFRADAPSWTNSGCTDGPFIYKTRNGQLLMLWSNFIRKTYCVGIARSRDGRIDGEWTQDDKLLFSEEISGNKDGGHGMIFKDLSGKMFLSIHSPNIATAEEKEEVVFIPIEEEQGTLICNL